MTSNKFLVIALALSALTIVTVKTLSGHHDGGAKQVVVTNHGSPKELEPGSSSELAEVVVPQFALYLNGHLIGVKPIAAPVQTVEQCHQILTDTLNQALQNHVFPPGGAAAGLCTSVPLSIKPFYGEAPEPDRANPSGVPETLGGHPSVNT